MTENLFLRNDGAERVISVCTGHLNDAQLADSLSRQLTSLFESESSIPNASRPGMSDRGQSDHESSIDRVTLDFELVGWLSSQGLNELISINRMVRTWGVRLVLANLQEPVREVFALTRLERMFELAEPHTQIN